MSKTQTIQTTTLLTRAVLDNSTFNKEARTIEVVYATETPVKRYDWGSDKYYNEILEISTSAIDGTRLDTGGAPVLDAHSRWSLNSQIGVVEKHWIDTAKKEARALVRLSTREELKGIVDDIAAGIIKNVSAGYTVQEYYVTDTDTIPEYRATKWTPSEISFVPIPADYNSGTRSKEDDTQYFTTKITKNNNMTTEAQQRAQESGTANPAPVQTAPAAAPATQTEDVGAIRTAAVEEERQRIAEITSMCTRHNLDADFKDKLIKDGTSLDNARAAVIDAIAERQNPAPNTTVTVTGGDEPAQLREAMILGLSHRAAPGQVPEFKDNIRAKDFANYRMLDFAKECLEAKGERSRGLSDQELIHRAITTTDFPVLLAQTSQRSLLRYYNAVIPDWKFLARQDNANDFRQKTGVKVDGDVTFEEIPESGEYKSTKFLQDENMKIQLAKYGRKIIISDRAIINDDLNVFAKTPQFIALGALAFQSELMWGLISGNAKTPDGTNLFHASHGNLGTAAALSNEGISVGRTAMRRQKSPSKKPLGIKPAYLIVPAELETAAETLLAQITATKGEDVNIFSKKLIAVVVDHFEDPKAWYLAADPNQSTAEGLVYSYLNGAEGLQTESHTNWDTDSVEIKASLNFSGAIWGHQNWYKNPGQ